MNKGSPAWSVYVKPVLCDSLILVVMGLICMSIKTLYNTNSQQLRHTLNIHVYISIHVVMTLLQVRAQKLKSNHDTIGELSLQ